MHSKKEANVSQNGICAHGDGDSRKRDTPEGAGQTKKGRTAKAVLTDGKEQWLTETFLKDMANTLAIVFPLKKFADDHNCSSEQVNWALIEFTGRPLVKLAQFVHENPQCLSIAEYSRKVSESCMESVTKQYCSSVFSTPESVKSTVGQKTRFCSASQAASSNSDEDSQAQLKTPSSIVHTNESKIQFKNTSQPVTAAENADDTGQGKGVDLHGTPLTSSMTGASLTSQSGTTSTDEESPMSVKAVTGFTEKEKPSNLKIRFKLNPPKRSCPVSNADSNGELPKSPLDRVIEQKRTKTLQQQHRVFNYADHVSEGEGIAARRWVKKDEFGNYIPITRKEMRLYLEQIGRQAQDCGK